MHKYNHKNPQNSILASSKETKLFKKNEIIYKEKDEISKIFIVLDGIVESTKSNNHKQSQLQLQKGSSLGLMDVILDRPFSRNMKAKSTVSLAVISKDYVKDLLNCNNFSAALIKSLAIDVDNKYPDTWS